MKRREALQTLGLASTHALFPSILTGFIASCSSPTPESDGLFFSQAEQKAVIKAIDLILPSTKSKAASEANTHLFLDEVFAKCMNADQQQIMHEGLAQLIDAMESTNFIGALETIDHNAFANTDEFAWYKAFKKYTLIGFFTSQEGETVASNYLAVPGDYQGDVTIDDTTLNYGHTWLKF
ncbi:MAG: gluconate 2-dehydrogenase subunit 3 family protein [Marinoscillum sp.]